MAGEPAAAVPRAALLLGWLGVTPFVGLAVAVAAGGPQLSSAALRDLVLYGAVILSFMGGVQWGLAMRAADNPGALPGRLAVSVLPAIVAWLSLVFLPGLAAVAGLACAFALLLAYDLATVRRGRAPAWYATLRRPLTAVVIVSLLVPIPALAS